MLSVLEINYDMSEYVAWYPLYIHSQKASWSSTHFCTAWSVLMKVTEDLKYLWNFVNDLTNA